MNAQVERSKFLENRKKGIGGSDVAAILGLSKYKSPYQLWLSKTGRDTGDDEQSEPAYWGNTLEDVVAKEFAKRAEVKIQRVNMQLVHPEHKWMIANIDRAVINPEIAGNVRYKQDKETGLWGLTTDRILECKTANQYMATLWGDENTEAVPDYYLTQCQWYMGVSQTDLCDLAVLIGGQKFRIYQIKFDAELFAMLQAECSKFWHEHVVADVPPELTTFDDVLHCWSKEDPKTVLDCTQDQAEIFAQYKDINSIIKEAEEQKDALKVKLGNLFEDKEIIKFGDEKLGTFKYQERTTIDSKALKAAHPELWEQFAKTSSTRVLRIS